jgi:hypothetical protein
VCDVLDEYDNNDDYRLDAAEAALLMWDVWRLLLASRDAGQLFCAIVCLWLCVYKRSNESSIVAVYLSYVCV